jgi:Na+-transporting NADH:ubiquinone oxidoreductase subunit F
MAPLRAQLSHLFETERTARKVSFWYGARSRQEIFYEEYFRGLAGSTRTSRSTWRSPRRCPRTTGPATRASSTRSCSATTCATHANPGAAEYYLCGPPMMIKACLRMLSEVGVPEGQVAFDEF